MCQIVRIKPGAIYSKGFSKEDNDAFAVFISNFVFCLYGSNSFHNHQSKVFCHLVR